MQLLPPKPKELLSAMRMSRDSLASARLRSADRIGLLAVERAGHEAVLQREQAKTDSRMPAAPSVCPLHPLVELARVRPSKAAATTARLDLVVLRCRGAVQVDVVDIGRDDAGARERSLERESRAETFGMRRRHVVRIAGFAPADQPRRAFRTVPFDQGETGRLANRDAATTHVEWSAGLWCDQFQ